MARTGFTCNFRQPLRFVTRNILSNNYGKAGETGNSLRSIIFSRHLSSPSCSTCWCGTTPLLHAPACRQPSTLLQHRRSFVVTSNQYYNERYNSNNNFARSRYNNNNSGRNRYNNTNQDSNRYTSRPNRSFEPFQQTGRNYDKQDRNNPNFTPSRPRSIMDEVFEENRASSKRPADFDFDREQRSSPADGRSRIRPEFDEFRDDAEDAVSDDAEAEESLQQGENGTAVDVEFLQYPDFNTEENKQFKMIQFEYHVLHQSGHMVPDKMTEKQWRDTLRLPTRAARLRFYRYLFKTEKAVANELIKKKEFSKQYREDRDRRLQEAAERDKLGLLTYGLNFNSFFFRIRESAINRHKHWRLCFARMLDRPLIIDVGYEEHMRDQELKSLALQIRDAHSYNCNALEPFYFQLVNLNRSGRFYEMLSLALPNIDTSDFIAELSDHHYLDLFPADQLCVLTKDSPNVLAAYDPEKYYVIGGLVDRRYPQPYTYAKAKREKIATARLPIDETLIWKMGDKNLTINQMVGIMVDIKNRDSTMEEALKRHIPTRKYMTDRDLRDAKEQNIPIAEMKARFTAPKPAVERMKARRNYSIIDELMTM